MGTVKGLMRSGLKGCFGNIINIVSAKEVVGTNKAGFSLAELVMVMVILGILSAYVVMRFDGVDSSARAVAIKTLASKVRVAADTVYNLSVAAGVEDDGYQMVDLRGQAVRVLNGYPVPDASGIVAAIAGGDSKELETNGIRVELVAGASDAIAFMRSDVREPQSCKVVYNYHGQSQPVVDVDVSNCR